MKKLRLAGVAVAATMLAAVAACGGGAADQTSGTTELVINSFGGDYEKVHREAVIAPFEKEFGVKVRVVNAYSADMLAQLKAQKNNPQFDVVHFSGGQEVVAAREGLIAKIAASDLSNAADLQPVATQGLENGTGPVIQVTPIGIIYRPDKVSPAPTSWKDVLNAKYAKHVAYTDLSNTYGLLGLLSINQALGGSLDNVTPGLDALGTPAKKGDAVVVKTSPEVQQAFAQRDIWLAPYAQDYAETLRKAGVNVQFVLPSEGAAASFITANVVANRPNSDLAKKFVDYELRPDVQAKWAEALRYSPTNTKTQLPANIAAEIVHGDQFDKLVVFDSAKIDANRQRWTNEWNQRIAS